MNVYFKAALCTIFMVVIGLLPLLVLQLAISLGLGWLGVVFVALTSLIFIYYLVYLLVKDEEDDKGKRRKPHR